MEVNFFNDGLQMLYPQDGDRLVNILLWIKVGGIGSFQCFTGYFSSVWFCES